MRKVTILLFLFISLIISQAYASHMIGMGVFYKHLQGQEYVISARFYRYCGGTVFNNGQPATAASAAPSLVQYRVNATQTTHNLILPQDTVYVLDLFCPTSNSLNSCLTGPTALMGIQVFEFSDTIDFAQYGNTGPNDWLEYSTGARTASTNIVGQPSMLTMASFDPNAGNSSAMPLSIEIPFLFGDSNSYDISLEHWDPDGDSLVYEFDTAYADYSFVTGFQNTNYVAGYSGTQPVPIASWSPNGTINMVPIIPAGFSNANYVIAFKVHEYDTATGAYNGFVHQDIQIVVVDDSALYHPYATSGVTNTTGLSPLGGNIFSTCEGTSFCYSVTYADSNASDTLVGTLLYDPNELTATVTQSGFNPATFTICGQVNGQFPNGVPLNLKVKDNHCPYTGIGNFTTVLQTTCSEVSFDTFDLCQGTWLNLDVGVDSLASWTTLSGATIQIGTNFNCLDTPCSEVSLSPNQTTVYRVEKWTTSGFYFVDTFTVVVTQQPNIQINTIGSPCVSTSFGLDLDVTNASGGFLTAWNDPAGILTNTNVDSTEVWSNTAGSFTFDYFVNVNATCFDSGSYTVQIHPDPTWQGYTSFPSQICQGDSANLVPNAPYNVSYSPLTNLSDGSSTPWVYFDGPITYTVDFSDTNGCENQTTLVLDPDSNVLEGVANDSNGNPITSGTVYLIEVDYAQDTVYALDSAMLGASGSFLFHPSQGESWVKVVPEFINYPNLIPTYYNGSAVVQYADSILTAFCDTTSLVINALSGINTNGPGFIGGSISQGAGRGIGDPVRNLDVVLTDEVGEALRWKRTDIYGYFRFEGLEAGTYKVFVDKLGVQNKLAPALTIDEAGIDSLEFTLYSNRLAVELTGPQGLTEILSDIMVYPNPFGDELIIESERGSIQQLSLMSISGHTVRQNLIQGNRAAITTHNLPAGLYMIEIVLEEGTTVRRKLVKE